MQVTRNVSLLSQWMAIDLYLREVDNLRFELSMNRCSDELAAFANEILLKGNYFIIELLLLSLSFLPSIFMLVIKIKVT